MTKLQITSLLIATLSMAARSPLAISAEPGKKKPLKVYILAGQSNMVGMADKRTLEHIKLLPESAKDLKDLFDEKGEPVELDDVWVAFDDHTGKLAPCFGASLKGPKIGTEYAFGIYMHKALKEPFLIIKTAWGGKSLCYDFRPPSADKWTPPPGHPDLTRKAEPPKLPIPEKLDLPNDYVPGEDIIPKYAKSVGAFMSIRPMRGISLDQVNGIYPLYIASSPGVELKGNPFQKGDLIIGLNGQGLREDGINQWRQEYYGEYSKDWLLSVTRWRKGKIETFDFDLSYRLPDGRAGIEKAKADAKANAAKSQEEGKDNKGLYYRMMTEQVKKVLKDIKSVYPGYDPNQGYELAGFVWLQGWNDLIDTGTYPNRDELRGYEQYSWLLGHLIRDVRKDLNAPNLPVVIGAIGVGGYEDPPESRMGYLQQAMAAPASELEFKGNVVAVQMGKYWDKQLAELIKRSAEVLAKKMELEREKGLTGEALEKAFAEYRAKQFTPLEEEILKKGPSNKAFHYLGSGKIMSYIGKGFADAMLELQKK